MLFYLHTVGGLLRDGVCGCSGCVCVLCVCVRACDVCVCVCVCVYIYRRGAHDDTSNLPQTRGQSIHGSADSGRTAAVQAGAIHIRFHILVLHTLGVLLLY